MSHPSPDFPFLILQLPFTHQRVDLSATYRQQRGYLIDRMSAMAVRRAGGDWVGTFVVGWIFAQAVLDKVWLITEFVRHTISRSETYIADMKNRRRTKLSSKKPSQSENDLKKKLLEKIAAELHSLPGAKVELNQWLPSLINPSDEREIDVLITVSPVGYEMRIAIECRNLAKRIEAKDIGEFADELNQVGIQTQGSIFVSASGYRRGAKTRAKELGMVLLTPTGLTADRLNIAVEEALQSIVFLYPIITQWVIHNGLHIDVYKELSEHERNAIYDENGIHFGTQFDLIWEKWHYDGIPPSTIGEHSFELDIPPGWHQVMQGKKVPILGATAKVRIWGLVASISGKVKRVSLLDAFTQTVEKFSLNAVFDTDKNQFPVTVFTTEQEFQSYMSQPRALQVYTERMRVPRMFTNQCLPILDTGHQASEPH